MPNEVTAVLRVAAATGKSLRALRFLSVNRNDTAFYGAQLYR